MGNKIGIIGFGNMGSAIGERLKSDYRVFVFDKDSNKIKNLLGIEVAKSCVDLISKVDILILAVKPQDFNNVLAEIKGISQDKLIISIAAGIQTNYIENYLGNIKIKVVRAMPNIGIKINESVTCLCNGKFATGDDFVFVQEIFNHLGTTLKIREDQMNLATAISGSGPAYFCYDIESNSIDPRNIPEETKKDDIQRLAEAGKKFGFDYKSAEFLANASITSTIHLLKNIDPANLREQITSKGGTTEAALKVLRKGGTWESAIKAAIDRAEGLSERRGK